MLPEGAIPKEIRSPRKLIAGTYVDEWAKFGSVLFPGLHSSSVKDDAIAEGE